MGQIHDVIGQVAKTELSELIFYFNQLEKCFSNLSVHGIM